VHADARVAYTSLATSSSWRSSLWLGTHAGGIRALDLREAPRGGGATRADAPAAHARLVTSMALHGSLLASASCDGGGVALWDVRKSLEQRLGVLAHNAAVHAVEFAPDGSRRLLTTCMDDRLRVFDHLHGDDGQSAEATTTIVHGAQTERSCANQSASGSASTGGGACSAWPRSSAASWASPEPAPPAESARRMPDALFFCGARTTQ